MILMVLAKNLISQNAYKYGFMGFIYNDGPHWEELKPEPDF